MSETKRIGFGKKIRAEWLAVAIRLRAGGYSYQQARTELESIVSATNPGKVAVAKSMSNIKQVVFSPAEANAEHSSDGIRIFQELGDCSSLAISWGLAISAYSFVASTAETIGRLLKVQQDFTSADLKRRLTEKLGERGFVQRVARYNLSSFLDWGIVANQSGKKHYKRGRSIRIESDELVAWLVEAVLLASEQSGMAFNHAISSPLLFPFEFEPVAAAIIGSKNPRLQITRESLSEEQVGLCHAQTKRQNA